MVLFIVSGSGQTGQPQSLSRSGENRSDLAAHHLQWQEILYILRSSAGSLRLFRK